MEQDFRAFLLADPGIAAISSLDIAFGERQQGAPYPAIVLYTVADVPSYTAAGDSGHTEARIQCDCLDMNYGDVKQVQRALTNAVSGKSATQGDTEFLGMFIESAGDYSGGPGAPDLVHRATVDIMVHYTEAG